MSSFHHFIFVKSLSRQKIYQLVNESLTKLNMKKKFLKTSRSNVFYVPFFISIKLRYKNNCLECS